MTRPQNSHRAPARLSALLFASLGVLALASLPTAARTGTEAPTNTGQEAKAAPDPVGKGAAPAAEASGESPPTLQADVAKPPVGPDASKSPPASAAPSPPGTEAKVAAKPVAAPATPKPLKAADTPPRVNCRTLDALNDPRCPAIGPGDSDSADRVAGLGPNAGALPAPPPRPPKAAPTEAGSKPAAEAAPPCPPAGKKGGTEDCPPGVHARGLSFLSDISGLSLGLRGGVAVALVAAIALAWWGLARRRAASPRPVAEPPGPFRRDLILEDPQGREWRFAGRDLTPGFVLGGDPRNPGFLGIEGLAPRHAEIWVQDGRLRVRPLDTHPLFLNDRLLAGDAVEIVSTGDRLKLGRMELKLIID
jgi:hypothetical protein